MNTSCAKLLSFAALSFLSATTGASAGDLQKTFGIAGCDYVYSGPVEEGDADKIDTMIPATSMGTRLCLDSPGGDFIEGLKMFHSIWNKDSIETYVRNGDGCFSACAIAFSGGSRVVGTGAIRSSAAVIEPGARLGFHAPRLVLDDESLHSSSEVAASYARALRETAHMFDLTQKVEHGARGMTDFLFKRMIETPPEEMYEIDTIGRASLAEIELAGIPTAKISWEAMRNVCDTAYVMTEDRFAGVSSARKAFAGFKDQGVDGSGRRIALEDRVWSWKSGYFLHFAIRGYPAPHKNEGFCRVSLSQYAWDRENVLSLVERDPTTQSFSVTFWQDAYVPVDSSFASYVESNQKAEQRVAVSWYAMWGPDTPLTAFLP